MINTKKENFLCKGCRHTYSFEMDLKGYYNDCNDEEKKECLKSHLCLDCRCNREEAKLRKSLEPSEATFYCPKCKIYTNDKTMITGCVFCKTPLIRTNRQVADYV